MIFTPALLRAGKDHGSRSSSGGSGCQAGGSFRRENSRRIRSSTASTRQNHKRPNKNTATRKRANAPKAPKDMAPYRVAKRLVKKSVKAASSSSWDT